MHAASTSLADPWAGSHVPSHRDSPVITMDWAVCFCNPACGPLVLAGGALEGQLEAICTPTAR